MSEENKKQEDIHLNKEVTRWVHHHRRLAKWLGRILIAGMTLLLYYLKNQQKHIEDENKKG